MDASAPTVITIPIFCAPKKAPCPHCGVPGKRLRTHPREVRTIEYKRIAILHITCGEYRAQCGCCSTFRTSPDGILPRWKYEHLGGKKVSGPFLYCDREYQMVG